MTPRDSFLRILSLVIANASPKCDQKELILIARSNGLIDDHHARSLMLWYGLQAE